MKLVERIKLFIEKEDLSLKAFNKKISAGTGYIEKQIQRNGSIGGDKLEMIINSFPELNPIWLITGKGSMLNEENPSQQIETIDSIKEDFRDSPFSNTEEKLRSCIEIAESKDKIIQLLEENAALKDEKIKYLQSDNKRLKEKLKDSLGSKSHKK